MKISEKLIETQIIYALAQQGATALKQQNKGSWNKNTDSYMNLPIGMIKGAADLLVFGLGFTTFFAEVKKPGEEQSEDQIIFEQLCLQRGIKYFIWRSKEEALATLETERNRNGK